MPCPPRLMARPTWRQPRRTRRRQPNRHPQPAQRYADLDQRQDYDQSAAPPPPATRRYPQLDQRQAYNAPSRQAQRARQQEQEYLADGWVYDEAYGWVPPRPPRRRGWYGYDD